MNGQVYIVRIEDQNIYKIGISVNDVKDRIKALQTGCPYKIRPVFVAQVENSAASERYLHHHFKACKMQGEWFKLSLTQLKEAIEILQSLQLENILKAVNQSTKPEKLEPTQNPIESWQALRETLKTHSQSELLEYMRWLPAEDDLIAMIERTPFHLASFLYYTLKIRDIDKADRARRTIGNLLILLDRSDLFAKLKMFGLNAET